MNDFRLVQMLRARWRLAALCALLTGAAALGLALAQAPRYQARATFIVKLDDSFESDRSALDAVERLVRSQEIPATFVQIAQSRRVREVASSHAGLDPAALHDLQLSAHFLPASTILEIVGEGDDPQSVAAMTNAAGEAVVEFTRDFFKVYALEALDRAVPPPAPFRPNVWLNLALGLVIGFALGIAILALPVYLDITPSHSSTTTIEIKANPLV